jgi:hypothetical protein
MKKNPYDMFYPHSHFFVAFLLFSSLIGSRCGKVHGGRNERTPPAVVPATEVASEADRSPKGPGADMVPAEAVGGKAAAQKCMADWIKSAGAAAGTDSSIGLGRRLFLLCTHGRDVFTEAVKK